MKVGVVLILAFLAFDASFVGVAEARAIPTRAHKAHAKIKATSKQALAALHQSHHRFEEDEPTGAEDNGDEGKGDESPKQTNEDDAGDDAGDAKDDIPDEDATTDAVAKEDADAEEAREKAEKNRKMWIFIIVTLMAIAIATYFAFFISQKRVYHQTNRTATHNPYTFSEFFNGVQGAPTLKAIMVGMVSGLVFGFIDNAGLFFGMEYLDPLLSKLPHGDENLVNAGYGNTVSDAIGAFLGTFIGRIVEEAAKMNDPDFPEYPVWTEAIGIVIGCILGVAIPRFFVAPTKKVYEEEMLEAARVGLTDEEIKMVMDKFDKLDKELDTKYPGAVKTENLLKYTTDKYDKIIADSDLNGDGWVEREEVERNLQRHKRLADQLNEKTRKEVEQKKALIQRNAAKGKARPDEEDGPDDEE